MKNLLQTFLIFSLDLVACSILKASAAEVPSSRREAFANSIPVKSQITV